MPSARRSRLGLLVAVTLLIATPPIVYLWLEGWRQQRVAQAAYAALATCLFGASQRPTGTVAAELRGSAIAASLEQSVARWPMRCAGYAARLEQSARNLRAERVEQLPRGGGAARCEGDRRCRALSSLLAELGQLRSFLRTAEVGAFEPAELHRAAQALQLTGGSARTVEPPPPPAALLTPASMQPLYRGNYLRLLTDPGGSEQLQLLFYEQRRRYGLCVVDLAGAVAARCRILPPTIPVEYAGELLAAEPGAPTVLYAQGFAGERWTEGLYDADTGQAILRVPTRPAGGMVWADGPIARLERSSDGSRVELVRRLPSGEVETFRAPVSAEVTAGPRLVWRHLVWTVAADDGRHRVFAQDVRPGADPFGPIEEIGATAPLEGQPAFDVCRTDAALVLLVTGQRVDQAIAGTLLFRTGEGWQRAIGLRIGSGRYGFTCQSNRAALSWITGVDEEYAVGRAIPERAETAPDRLPVRGQYRVSRLRCRPGQCERQQVAIELARYARDSRYVAGDLGDAMVVMWRSPLGDVRMRLGPMADLPRAPEVPLFDDLEHGGFGWDLERDPMFGRSGAVLVLVSAQIAEVEQSWTYGIRLDAAGRVRPIRVNAAAAPPPLD